MDEAEFIKKIKKIVPNWKPIEERTKEEQEEAYDSLFDDEEDDD